MLSKTEQAYHYASGQCLDAMQSLRRFSGAEAIESLKAAIRAIEDEQRRARREDRTRMDRIPSAAPFPSPVEF